MSTKALAEAAEAFRADRWSKAAELLSEGLEDGASNALALNRLRVVRAIALFRAGRSDAAVAVLAELDPETSELPLVLRLEAALRLQRNEVDEAVVPLDKLARLRVPEAVSRRRVHQVHLGLAAIQRGAFSAALS